VRGTTTIQNLLRKLFQSFDALSKLFFENVDRSGSLGLRHTYSKRSYRIAKRVGESPQKAELGNGFNEQIPLEVSSKGSVNVGLGGFMPNLTTTTVADLPKLAKSALRRLWTQLFNTDPPAKLRRELMIPILAYRLQEHTFGSISAQAKGRLRQLSQSFKRNPHQTIACVPSIKPGTRLVRQWRDEVHLVNVETNGYEYQGAKYQNLSEIARLITGTRWSGPAFFGIKNEQNSKFKEVQ
jgi:hypothetical protein